MKPNAIPPSPTNPETPPAPMGGKTQISIRLDDDQYAALQRICLRRRSQVGVLVREAVQQYLWDNDDHFRASVEASINEQIRQMGGNSPQ